MKTKSVKIGFKGTFLVEPKPMEPSKHQYDFKLPLEMLRDIAAECGEPRVRSGKQELLEQMINMYLV